ncbi:hypothetical protein [Streptomyces vietnamensis]|uniref:Uncharacterized protein n=1 Tax=Streptomyces vietnamensis TaxID=362257 RepID=A0A0B5I6N4_9ACTN|nr:hypothetical protein [Streptomyces vietnamensis]AJF66057.1 hypothetical protein SVTN_18325 [Streptomyces vietnamensis]
MGSYDDETAYGRELTRTMDRAMARLPLNTEALVTEGAARGVRRRRRRRAAAWGAACTAAIALTTTAVLTTGSPGLPGGTAGTVTVAVPEFAGPGAGAPAGREPISGAATAVLLAELLPGRPPTDRAEVLDSDPASGSVQTYALLPLGAGAEAGTVAVWLQGDYARLPAERKATAPADPASKGRPRKKDGAPTADPSHQSARGDLERHYSCPRDKAADDCRISKLPDGSVLLTHRDDTNARGALTVDLLRTDGTRVVVTATGTELSTDTLTTVATSPRWQQWVDPATNKTADQANVGSRR